MTTFDAIVGSLGHIPDLPGARCRGRHELFDATIAGTRDTRPDDLQYARAAAVRLCQACPALDACRAWFTALRPDERPHGVVAGRLPAARKEQRSA